MKTSPEQLAAVIKQISDLCAENEMKAIFVGTVRANEDVNIVHYPGHDPNTEEGKEQIARQLYQAAVQIPKSHLGTIILNVAATMCVANPEIGKEFMEDLGKRHAQMQFDAIRREVFKTNK